MTHDNTTRGEQADEGLIETDLATYRMVTITCPKCKGQRFRGRTILETCPQCCGRGEYGVLVKVDDVAPDPS